jgi:uncharacterized membrane protein
MQLRTMVLGILITGVALLAFDIVWLTMAAGLYDRALGSLKREVPYMPAAVLFYAMYTVATYAYAVRGASSVRHAATRGAGLGFVAYSTYELTNWAVLRGWPGFIVAVDTVWGVVLTGTAAAIAHFLMGRIFRAR